MADAADSKSVALKSVRVQVPPPAHVEPQAIAALFIYEHIVQNVANGDYFGDYSAFFLEFSTFIKASVARLLALVKAWE